MTKPVILSLFALSLSSLGCTGDQKVDDEKPTDSNVNIKRPEGPVRMADESFDESAYASRTLDLNGDGIGDAWQFSSVVEGKRVVIRKEVDLDSDGRVDLIRKFSERGDVTEERLDLDFDGRVDVVNFFEKGKITRKEYDTNYDSKVDVWTFYEGGVLDRKEADLDHDGRLDYWEYYERGKVDRVGVDRDGDGQVDDWEVSAREAGG